MSRITKVITSVAKTAGKTILCIGIASSVIGTPTAIYLKRGRRPLDQANAEAALVQRATEFCSGQAPQLKSLCRDAFINGAKSGIQNL